MNHTSWYGERLSGVHTRPSCSALRAFLGAIRRYLRWLEICDIIKRGQIERKLGPPAEIQ
jgi:hypothetical protein